MNEGTPARAAVSEATRTHQSTSCQGDSAVVSVIIPVYNDAQGLRDTVESLLEQDYPKSCYEIVIVDNGSTDSTFRVATEIAAAHPDLVRVVEEKCIQSSYAARNRGIASARGDILCFVDADMTARPTYLAQINATFRAEDVHYLGHAVDVVADHDSFAARYNQAQGFPIEDYMTQQHFSGAGCLAVRRTLLQDVGGFDSRLESSGDLEFGQRVHAKGHRQEFAKDIVLLHPARSSYRALLAKSRRLGRGRAQLEHYYPERYQNASGWWRRLSAYVPYRPTGIRHRFAASGQQISLGFALLLSIWSLPVKWAKPLARARELRRLRREERLQRHRSEPSASMAALRSRRYAPPPREVRTVNRIRRE